MSSSQAVEDAVARAIKRTIVTSSTVHAVASPVDVARAAIAAYESVSGLREALAFYADEGNYVPAGIAPTIWKDNGERAREALRDA